MKIRGKPLVLLTLALFVSLLAACGSRSPSGQRRVVVIALDGLDWRIVEEMRRGGGLPNIGAFLDRGLSGRLETMAPAYSPVIWATVATGKLPEAHGITGFVTPASSPDGGHVPFTSNLRRAKALWNILGEHQRRVAVVGWWTTWPAEPVHGVMVSDRMLYNRFNLWWGFDRAGSDLPAQTHPPELFQELVGLTRGSETLESEFFERFRPDGPRPVMERHLHDPWYELLLVYARDRAYGRLLDRVLEEGPFDFVAHYLNGPDIASHYFWKYRYPEEWDEPLDPAEVARAGDVIERYYGFVDEAIAPLLEQADEQTVVILLSDHGFVTGHRADSPAISGTHYRAAPPGVLALAGGGLPRGAALGRTSVIDVAPTVLHLLGLAVGRDMAGRVIDEVAKSTPGRPVAFVDSYETGVASGPAEPLASEYDATILEKLRALGYIGAED